MPLRLFCKSRNASAIRRLMIFLMVFAGTNCLQGQKLSTRFDPVEYLDLFRLSNLTYRDSPAIGARSGSQQQYELLYFSPETGLKNHWDLWIRDDNVGILVIRGTVPHPHSWMENFYAAMIPATGSLQLNDSVRFDYQLARDSKASVHAGWTLGLAYMGPAMAAWIERLQREKNISDWIIFGHSQGGALAFLATSYLKYKSLHGDFGRELGFKTYCSAAPKPGNLFYAYDFDFLTHNGVAFCVVNAADWVPESPPTIQTLNDFNPSNPFFDAETLLGKQKWPANWYLSSVYGKLKRKPRKARDTYQKFFGHRVYQQVRKTLPGFKEPDYAPSLNYMRAGIPIVLMPDSAYRQKFPESREKVFIHHGFEPYRMLVETIYPAAFPKQ